MRIDENAIEFKAVRAQGPGGQRVNRRATKVQLKISVAALGLTPAEERLVRERLAHRINRADELEVSSEAERFQVRNRADALARLEELVQGALVVAPPRIPTEPPRGAKERRHLEKELRSEKKRHRAIKWNDS